MTLSLWPRTYLFNISLKLPYKPTRFVTAEYYYENKNQVSINNDSISSVMGGCMDLLSNNRQLNVFVRDDTAPPRPACARDLTKCAFNIELRNKKNRHPFYNSINIFIKIKTSQSYLVNFTVNWMSSMSDNHPLFYFYISEGNKLDSSNNDDLFRICDQKYSLNTRLHYIKDSCKIP